MSTISDVRQLQKQTLNAIAKITDLPDAEKLRVRVLGRAGTLTAVLKSIKDVPEAECKQMGATANRARVAIAAALVAKKQSLETKSVSKELAADKIDVTEPGDAMPIGALHPITQVRDEVLSIFTRMGFSVYDTPEIDTDHYNFESLNIPADHPARSAWDTFYTENGMIPRVHTSTMQARVMEKNAPPIQAIQVGRCFRNERTDATHDHTFNQIDGFVVGDGVSLSHMKQTLQEFFNELFQRDINIRFRPGFFPFVDPGVELEMQMPDGRWLEMLGCGMIHRNVYAGVAKTNKAYANQALSGFAFGMGLDRIVMMRNHIKDIRWFTGGDLRFLKQFS